ncbi:MAG: YggS family pyridoxal phosphate-dependent enzyme [Anaerolineae bacterium]|nr:YggS family pyridoxal phosphate-dependent enzyme [Anaerolineae bacterium]
MIGENITQVRERIAAACQRAGRSPEEITLVAVSKTRPASDIIQAVEHGIMDFGENRLEEAAAKMPALADYPVRWHMIGHVQSRKSSEVATLGFHLIHSLDTIKLARRYSQFAVEKGLTLPVLLEINVSGETTKSGWIAYNWEKDDAVRLTLWHDIEMVLSLPGLQVQGLMTMAPIVEHMEAARPVFQSLAILQRALGESYPDTTWLHLSMGMTDDFDVAIEEGATLVRIGRAIFGERE